MANNTYSASGGSGAGYHAIINITEAGYYTVTVGSGGKGVGAGSGGSPVGINGGATTIETPSNVTLISAGGGTGGRSGPVWATAGTGGTLTKDSSLLESIVYTSTNGNNGGSYAGGSYPTVSGASSPISGHTWGATGSAAGSYSGGRVSASYHGYFFIKYIGEIPVSVTYTIAPTPSDATVTLSSPGAAQVGNSITVFSGATVSWQVSKSGYQTQSGTVTPTEDTIESVVLEDTPLYYCYREYNYWLDRNLYYYTQQEYTTIPNGTTVFAKNDLSQVTTSAQLNDSFSANSLMATRYPSGDLYT